MSVLTQSMLVGRMTTNKTRDKQQKLQRPGRRTLQARGDVRKLRPALISPKTHLIGLLLAESRVSQGPIARPVPYLPSSPTRHGPLKARQSVDLHVRLHVKVDKERRDLEGFIFGS